MTDGTRVGVYYATVPSQAPGRFADAIYRALAASLT